jgi:hypothetical protein
MADFAQFQAINDPKLPLSELPSPEQDKIWRKVAQSLVAIREGRAASEGWTVSNEALVADALKEMVINGTDRSYVIISSGEYYVQFKHFATDGEVYCEAVSETYLPDDLPLSKKAANRLVGIGFHEPEKNLDLTTSAPTPSATLKPPTKRWQRLASAYFVMCIR